MEYQQYSNSRLQGPAQPRAGPTHRGFIEPVRYKTRMCRHFETTGHCPYYPRCAFAHGPEDMRTVAVNANDGITHISRLREYQDNTCTSVVSGQGPEGAFIPGCQCPTCCIAPPAIPPPAPVYVQRAPQCYVPMSYAGTSIPEAYPVMSVQARAVPRRVPVNMTNQCHRPYDA